MVNPFLFDSGDVLTAATLNTIGDWNAWTPTWTNLTVGNGSVVAYYAEVNGIVFYQVEVNWGSTTSASGSWQCTAPITQETTQDWHTGDTAALYNSGSSIYTGTTMVLNSSGTKIFWYHNTASGTFANLTGTVPFTWGTNDQARASGFYRRTPTT
jgi:hypothetical protein